MHHAPRIVHPSHHYASFLMHPSPHCVHLVHEKTVLHVAADVLDQALRHLHKTSLHCTHPICRHDIICRSNHLCCTKPRDAREHLAVEGTHVNLSQLQKVKSGQSWRLCMFGGKFRFGGSRSSQVRFDISVSHLFCEVLGLGLEAGLGGAICVKGMGLVGFACCPNTGRHKHLPCNTLDRKSTAQVGAPHAGAGHGRALEAQLGPHTCWVHIDGSVLILRSTPSKDSDVSMPPTLGIE